MKVYLGFFFFLLAAAAAAQPVAVSKLLCESAERPLGVETAQPSLSWQLTSARRGVMQTAYRILVADDPAKLKAGTGNLWDSRRVASSQSLHVPYAGAPLQATKTYYWQVQVWDNAGEPSAWSAVSAWQMGLPAKEDWKGARWIGYEQIPDSLVNSLPTDGKKDKYTGNNILPLLRKEFSAQKPVKKATLFISGLGHFELSLNGKKIGDHFLDPGWTKYDRQALYVPFDVTANLTQGQNAIGVMLGNGFYYIPPVPGRYRKLKVAFGYPKMICRLAIEYADGSAENIISDESWRTAKSPITFSSIYGGEDYNAALEQEGWNTARFNDGAWQNAVLVDGPPLLNAQVAKPLKVMETFVPRKATEVHSGQWVFDLGQNASGIPAIRVQGKKGDTIRIIPAELLKDDGTVTQKVTGGPFYLQYILKGDGVEEWQPRFTYYGFRYLQINGAVPIGKSNPSGLPVLHNVKGLHIRNAAERVGSFLSSNDLFNRTYTLIDWAIKSNMVSVLTDCPHREKLGWLEQAHLMGASVRHNYDVAGLYRKQLDDMRYSQTPEGLVPEIAPEYVKFEWGGDMFRDSPEWGSSAIIVPWYYYRWYGNADVLRANYAMMQRYAAYLKGKAKGHILYQGLGDWYDLGPKPPGVSQLTPMGITGTAMYYYDLNILLKVARLLGKKDDAAAYEAEAVLVRKAFNDTFFNRETAQYGTGSQAANAVAVYMNLVEPEHREAVIANIIGDIRRRKNSLTAGDIGYRYLLRVLHEAGRDDVIYDMNSRSDVPGYGYQLAKGATALTESWSALPTNSNNHFMLGHLMEWFYTGLGGIQQQKTSVGYKDIVIDPRPVGDVSFANTSYESPYGIIRTAWRKDAGRFVLDVQIPVNTTATVVLPAKEAALVREGDRGLNGRKDLAVAGMEDEKLKVTIGSGRYRFIVAESAKELAQSKK